ncbi:MAG: hypothetical protein ACXW3K_02065 [Brevundimonas sp.]
MKLLRLIVMLAVLGYAGWLAWPFISPLIEGAAPGAAAARAGAGAPTGGDLFGVLPVWTLWAGATGLYVIAALMLGAGNTRAAAAYFLGFAADVVLRLAIDRQGDGAARSGGPTTITAPEAIQGAAPVEPVWMVLGAVFLLGVLVMFASRRIRRKRTAGQLTF